MRTTIVCCLLLALAAGCAHPPRLVRNTPVVRMLFYPPRVEMSGALAPTDDTKGETFDHSAFARVLRAYVDEEGVVNYGALKRNAVDLNAYLYALAGANLGKLGKFDRLAMLINAYNAFTLQLVIENPGIESIRDIASRKRWNARRWRLGSDKVSLADLERRRIRAFGDPRIHFALVCAARGCMKLRREPYTGDMLLEQLRDQAEQFFHMPKHFRYDVEERRAYLSEILDWYRNDFGVNEADIVRYAVRHAEPWVTEETRRHSLPPTPAYIPFDWRLNGTW